MMMTINNLKQDLGIKKDFAKNLQENILKLKKEITQNEKDNDNLTQQLDNSTELSQQINQAKPYFLKALRIINQPKIINYWDTERRNILDQLGHLKDLLGWDEIDTESEGEET